MDAFWRYWGRPAADLPNIRCKRLEVGRFATLTYIATHEKDYEKSATLRQLLPRGFSLVHFDGRPCMPLPVCSNFQAPTSWTTTTTKNLQQACMTTPKRCAGHKTTRARLSARQENGKAAFLTASRLQDGRLALTVGSKNVHHSFVLQEGEGQPPNELVERIVKVVRATWTQLQKLRRCCVKGTP